MEDAGDEISEYERLRLKRIEENRKCLLELGLLSNNPPSQSHPKEQSSNSSPRSAKKRRQSTANPAPIRRIITRRSVQLGDQYQHEHIEGDEEDEHEAPRSKKKEYRENFYGPVAGVKVGDSWEYRLECSSAGIHRPTVAGIHGGPDGAYSIALSGGYEDDIDYGDHFTYTGAGGRDLKGTKANPKNLRTAPQSKDQTADGLNAALIASVRTKNPVRVIRGYKLNSLYAPESGYRYDGLYSVDKYWTETGLAGYLVYKFKLSRMKGQDPPIWEQEVNQENIEQHANCQKTPKKPDLSPGGKSHGSPVKTPQNFSPTNAEITDKDQNNPSLNRPLSNSSQKTQSVSPKESKRSGVSVQLQNGKSSPNVPSSPLKGHQQPLSETKGAVVPASSKSPIKTLPSIGKDSLHRYFSSVRSKNSSEGNSELDNVVPTSLSCIERPDKTLNPSGLWCNTPGEEACTADMNGSCPLESEIGEEAGSKKITPSPRRVFSPAKSRNQFLNDSSNTTVESSPIRNEEEGVSKSRKGSKASSPIKSPNNEVVRPIVNGTKSSPAKTAKNSTHIGVAPKTASSNLFLEFSKSPKKPNLKVNGLILNETKLSPTETVGKITEGEVPNAISCDISPEVTSPTKSSSKKKLPSSEKAANQNLTSSGKKIYENENKEKSVIPSSGEMTSCNDRVSLRRDLFNCGSNAITSPSKNVKQTPSKEKKNISPSKRLRKSTASPQNSAAKDFNDSFSMLKSPPSGDRKKSKTCNTLDRYFVKKFASNDVSRPIRTSFPKGSPAKNKCDSDDESCPAFIGFNEITINNARNRLKLLTDFLPTIVQKQACRNKLNKFKKKKKNEEVLKCSSSKRDFITSIDKIRDLSIKIASMSKFDPNAGFIPECFVKLDPGEMFSPDKERQFEEGDPITDSSTDVELCDDTSITFSDIPKKLLSPQKLLDLISSDEECEDEPFLGFSSVSKRSMVRNAFLIQKYTRTFDSN